jgi:hypothetical protein
LWLLFVPPLAGGAYVVAAGHHLWPRFFYFAFGFAALVAVRGAMTLEEAALARWSRGGVRYAGFLCAAMVAVSAFSLPRAFGPKQDYEGAKAFVESARKPGDTVVMAGLIAYPYENLYKTPWQKVTSVEQLNAVRSAGRVFLLYTLEPVLLATDPEIAAAVKRDFHLARKFPGTLEHGTVYVYISDGPLSASANSKKP